MEVTGRIVAILPERSGVSQRGEWKSQQFVIETQEQYPKHICFEVFGADRLAQFNIQGGEVITVSFDIDARQWQDRWFNSIKAWNVVRQGQQTTNGNQPANAPYVGPTAGGGPTNFPPPQPPTGGQGKSDDLPF